MEGREWHYCPTCKGKLVRKVPPGDDRPRLVCSRCERVLYENPAPTACAVIVEGDRVLLTKRAYEPKKGLWDLPGGYIEVGETPEEALHREVWEEVGMQITIVGLLGFFVDTYGDGGTDTLNISFLAHPTGDARQGLRPGSDVEEIVWFDKNSLPDPDLLAFRNTREALRAWLQMHSSGR